MSMRRRPLMSRQYQSGYTLIELLIVMIMTSVFTGLIMFFTFSYWRYGYALEADLDTLTQRFNAGDFIREQVGTSSGLIMQNGLVDVNTMAVDPTDGAGYWLENHAIPGNKPMPAAGSYSPLLYYRRLAVNTAGNVIMNGTQPYEDEYVLYMNGTTKSLMVRTIANSFAADNRAKSSCPPASATANCPADKTLLGDLASVDMRYFSRSGNLIDYTSAYDTTINQYIGPDFPTVEVVELTVNLAKKPYLQKMTTTKSSTIIRIALRNT
jgi:prepilin-type N-terminal cleavage/methylation domain-containing protein